VNPFQEMARDVQDAVDSTGDSVIAAVDGVMAHLADFPGSAAREDIWETHPLLTSTQLETAELFANLLIQQVNALLVEMKRQMLERSRE
jgi:hypothetical protein